MSKTIDNLNDLETVQADISEIQSTAHFTDENFDAKSGDIDTDGLIVTSSTLFGATLRSTANTAVQNALQPCLSHNSDSNTGIYFDLADGLGISAGGAERVLVTDTNMNVSVDQTNTAQPAIFMRQTIAQSVVSNVATPILYDVTVKNQDATAISYAAGTFTINSTGLYLVNAEIYYAADTASFRSILILHSGTPSFRWGHNATEVQAGQTIRMVTSAMIPVTSGDTIQILARHINGSNLTVGTTADDFNALEASIIKIC